MISGTAKAKKQYLAFIQANLSSEWDLIFAWQHESSERHTRQNDQQSWGNKLLGIPVTE